jgi:hypothetical protein
MLRRRRQDLAHTEAEVQPNQRQQVGRQYFGLVDFIGGSAIHPAMESEDGLRRYLVLMGDAHKWVRHVLVFYAVNVFLFGAGVACAVMFAGINPVIAIFLGLASASGITLIGLSAVIQKGFRGRAEKQLRQLTGFQRDELSEEKRPGD